MIIYKANRGGGTGPPPPKGNWEKALELLSSDRSMMDLKNLSQTCIDDLGKLQVKGPPVTPQQLNNKIINMSWLNGTTSSDLITINGITTPAKDVFKAYGSAVSAATPIGGNTTYWNPGAILATDRKPYGQSLIQGMEFHEGLHGLGLSDDDIQIAFFGKKNSEDTDNITRKLAEDCFAPPK